MGAKTILVVDDEYDIVSTLEMVLSLEGYQVRSAFHGKEALEILKDGFRPDLIISDVMMPVMNGYQLLECLKADPSLCDLPVLLVSAARPDRSQVPDGSIALFIRKPFDLDQLIDDIHRVIHAQNLAR